MKEKSNIAIEFKRLCEERNIPIKEFQTAVMKTQSNYYDRTKRPDSFKVSEINKISEFLDIRIEELIPMFFKVNNLDSSEIKTSEYTALKNENEMLHKIIQDKERIIQLYEKQNNEGLTQNSAS